MELVLLLLVVCGCAANYERPGREHHPLSRPYVELRDEFFGGAPLGGVDTPFVAYDEHFSSPQVEDVWRKGPPSHPRPPFSNHQQPRNYHQINAHFNKPHFNPVPHNNVMMPPQMPKVPLNPHIDATKHHGGPQPSEGLLIHKKRQ